MKARLRPKRLLAAAAVLLVLASAIAAAADVWIRHRASGREYSVAEVPPSDVALIFGAQVYRDGKPSPYLARRLDLGAELLQAGKVKALLLSGDNGTAHYNEPEAMRRYLIGKGVPADKLALDYAGFNTYASCARAYRIFGVRRAIAVTQDFSVPRTVAMCQAVGINTTAVADRGQRHDLTYRRIWLRDQLADTKAVWSILVRPDPKFLGQQETTVTAAMNAPGE